MILNYTTGYAGTGKSTELIKLAKTLEVKTSIIIAPTHKALHRLKDSLPTNIEVKTIHSLLGWIPSINESAKHINNIDTTIKLERELSEYKTIIIDEAGMMSEDMLLDLTAKLEEANDFETSDIVLHLFLDPYQLLPVKGLQIQTDPSTTVNLTRQYRSESKDIVKLYTKFVDYLIGTNTTDLSTPYSDNVIPLDIKQFKQGDRLLAYTNKAVGEWNTLISKHLGIKNYTGQEVQLGSMLDLVLCSNFVTPSLKDLLCMWESGTLKLQNNQINSKFLEASLNELLNTKSIQFITDGKYTYPVIVGIGKSNIVIKKAKEAAIKNRTKFKTVYALGRAFIMDYPFATTVHKAQGSEFNTVFIDKEDIQLSIRNSYYNTYSRLMYVAISRCKKTLYIT